ncbi:hypothetical protein THASP1DRAFT_30868 [Thamnocephalis sphaerospora]|uniref:Uncharacterized protein n=1 Tax=Thamnocephalis sphaerospora TaxID=78915 RepID=A0A4P9XNC4_9FUNG|nr:hypothetical protein THASP1DRAFT_30868 [Thamnocephalis sphaerospora]|eukprot:RKP07322.1 hypothetical protein THASP1DRAFT_30868 [Thamnocephalis sphaerospora]
MRTLGLVLRRLHEEKLTPPVTLSQLVGKNSGHSGDAPTLRPRHSNKSLYGQILEGDTDLDDPRWEQLFREYFVDNSDPGNDDLLFFVRHSANRLGEDDMHDGHRPLSVASSRQSKSSQQYNDSDPVFVKRKQSRPNRMPPIGNDIVLWKETFYLNLIVQVPVRLTVAVCRRNVDSPSPGGHRSSMVQTTRRVSRYVYAMPTKSNVNVKESNWECSWPLIYYVVEDFEEAFENLVVRKGEYLCVELSASVPVTAARRSSDATPLDSSGGTAAALSALVGRRVTTDANGNGKVTLFQGAASYASLMDTYQRKTAARQSRRFRLTHSSTPPTEFIMMRGPGGKGHAQVAITGYDDTTSSGNGVSGRESASRPQSSLHPDRTDSPLAPFVRPNSAASFFQSLKRMALNEHPEPVAYTSLQCCMTFVNVPWTSIVADLVTFWRMSSSAATSS